MNEPIPTKPLKRILVIAEDQMTRSSMVRLLEGEGYTVRAAQDSMEALALVEQYEPHVIVLQAQVPAEIGLDMLQPLRRRRPALLVPAMLVAADATVILDSVSQGPQVLSDQPMAFTDVLPHVDRLALPTT
jgi:CheY-like chemotaxis protein